MGKDSMTEAEAMAIYRRFIRLVETTFRSNGAEFITDEVNAAIRRLGGLNSPLADLCYESTLKELEQEGYRFCVDCKVQLDWNYDSVRCTACWEKLYNE